MEISFTEKNVTLQSAVTMTASSCNILRIIDDPVKKQVTAKIVVGNRAIDKVLWQDEAYDEAGDWTQQEANDRIIELL